MIWKVSMDLVSMVFLLICSVMFAFTGFYMIWSGISVFVEWEFCLINSCSMVMSFVVDWVSMMFSSFVMLISSMVLCYSGEYMKGDYNMNRFMYLVLAFVLSMEFMVMSPNLISILLGWDGLGLVSYALVIYYQNEKSANSGMITVMSNRVGDVAILLSIGLFLSLGGWNFMVYGGILFDESWIVLKCLVVLAAMTKSAQIPFSAWLPAAMAAPTPVSALVHSSTLVTAGVFLLIRFSPALYSSTVLPWLLLVSCLTMFMAGLGANFEYDLKKIIALSTLSQLGLMISILCMGFPDLAFFHLLTHAVFKALLFMCAGVVIHNVKNYQDIRCMGGLIHSMPLTSACMILSNLGLCGMPFLAGFYSKDLILEMVFMSKVNNVVFVLYVLATGLTVCYTFRLIFYMLTSDWNMSSFVEISDSSDKMTSPMLVMGLAVVFSGAVCSWGLFPESYMICLTPSFKSLVLKISILGGVLGYILNIMSVSYSIKLTENIGLTSFVGSMWFMPHLSGYLMSLYNLSIGKSFEGYFDKGWLELSGGQGGFSVAIYSSNYLDSFQKMGLKVLLSTVMVWVGVLLIL